MLSLDLASNTLGHFDEFICFQNPSLWYLNRLHGTKPRVLESYFSFSREDTLGERWRKGIKKEIKKADVKIKG